MTRWTATRTFPRGDLGVMAPSWRDLFGFDSEDQRPRTLRIDARVLSGGDDDHMRTLAASIGGAGVWWTMGSGEYEGERYPWHGGAALRLSYGSSPGIQRVVYADLRSGEYAIPPCETFSLSAAYWAPNGNPDHESNLRLADYELEVSAELAAGECIESSPLIVSAWRRVAPWVSEVRCAVPPGAYAWEVSSDRQHIQAHCGSVYCIRDYSGRWLPPTTPLPITGADAHEVGVWTDLSEETGEPLGEGDGWHPTITFYVR